jgi:tetratricopeptide (TPR) repeat protein
MNRPQAGGVPPDSDFERTLTAAQGFFQLGMWNESWNELETLAPETRNRAQVILLRVMIYNNLNRWEEASIIGTGALRHYPDFGALYVATAYALWHHSGPAEAKAVIAAGEPYLEEEAIFHVMLACYDSALGHLYEAKECLQRAFELDPAFKLRSLDEPDLASVWDSL